MKNTKKNEYNQINKILTDAFKENKSVNYVLKEKKQKYISRLMNYSIYMGEKFGNIFINEENTACAIMIDPEQKKTTLGTIFQDIKFAFTISGLNNVKKVYTKELITKNTFPKDINFIQLWFLAVSPEAQGKGAGTKILNDIIEYYRDKKDAIILETSTERNLPFYHKNGFEIYNKNEKDFEFNFYFFIHKYQ